MKHNKEVTQGCHSHSGSVKRDLLLLPGSVQALDLFPLSLSAKTCPASTKPLDQNSSVLPNKAFRHTKTLWKLSFPLDLLTLGITTKWTSALDARSQHCPPLSGGKPAKTNTGFGHDIPWLYQNGPLNCTTNKRLKLTQSHWSS